MSTKTKDEWLREGEALFGADKAKWRFICPSCGRITTVAEYKEAKTPEGAVGFSCIGRYLGKSNDAFPSRKHGKGCNYTGGGLINVNPVTVDGVSVFDFAPLPK